MLPRIGEGDIVKPDVAVDFICIQHAGVFLDVFIQYSKNALTGGHAFLKFAIHRSQLF